MARNHFITPTVPDVAAKAVRLGAGNTTNDNLSELDVGKIVKLTGESQYDLAVAGDQIEGIIFATELATQNGWSVGSVYDAGRAYVVFDGLQATPGTGTVAIGDYVVAGTITAKGTALTTYPKVCKATALSFATTPTVNFPAGSNLNYKWRVVSLGSVGTGAVGTVGVIERI
jgi:hypothetical protein